MLIGFIGKKQHGKSTASKPLLAIGFRSEKFADALKDMVRSLLRSAGFPGAEIERYVEGDLKEQPLAVFGGKSVRWLMQSLGTDWGRDMVCMSLWTGIWQERVRRLMADGADVLVDDVRFPDEAALVKAMGGVLVRIVNPRVQAPLDPHPSETALDGYPADYHLLNDGTPEALWEEVEEIREREGGLLSAADLEERDFADFCRDYPEMELPPGFEPGDDGATRHAALAC